MSDRSDSHRWTPMLEARAACLKERDDFQRVRDASAHVFFGLHGHAYSTAREKFAATYLTDTFKRASSMLQLAAPLSLSKPSHLEVDYLSILIFARSMIETYMRFFYVCGENVPDEEREFREIIFSVHDAQRRLQLARDGAAATRDDFQKALAARVGLLEANPVFRRKSKKDQDKHRGSYHWPLRLTEVAESLKISPELLTIFHSNFSDATHGGPLYNYEQFDEWGDPPAAWLKIFTSARQALAMGHAALAATVRDYAAFRPEIYAWAQEWVARCKKNGWDPALPAPGGEWNKGAAPPPAA